MPSHRAILTDYERDCLAGKRKIQRDYETRSRIQARIGGPLADDVVHLREHDLDLLEEIRAVVCDDVDGE